MKNCIVSPVKPTTTQLTVSPFLSNRVKYNQTLENPLKALSESILARRNNRRTGTENIIVDIKSFTRHLRKEMEKHYKFSLSTEPGDSIPFDEIEEKTNMECPIYPEGDFTEKERNAIDEQINEVIVDSDGELFYRGDNDVILGMNFKNKYLYFKCKSLELKLISKKEADKLKKA